MLKLYRIRTRSRRGRIGVFHDEWQYIKEQLVCFRQCPIYEKFVVIGWVWAGNSMFGYPDSESATEWGIKSLNKQKEEYILLTRIDNKC